MKTFLIVCLKVLLVLTAAVLIMHMMPLIALPLALLLPIGGLVILAMVVGGAVGLGAIAVLAAIAIAIVAALSPVLIPVALICGIIWLIKRLGSSGTQAQPAR